MENQTNNPQFNARKGGLAFITFIAVYLALALILQPLAEIIFGKGSVWYTAVCSLVSIFAILTVILLYNGKEKTSFAVLTKTQSMGGWYVLLSLLLSGGMFLGLGLVNELVAGLVVKAGLNAGGIALPLNDVGQLILFSITIAVLPAIFEEMFFRGLLLNCFSGMKSGVAIVLSALCFSLYHGSLTQLIYQFIYGVGLAFLAHNSKSIIPCIISHFLNNFVIILLTFLQVSINFLSPIFLIVGINLLAFFGTAIFFTFRKSQKNVVLIGEVKGFFLPYGLFAIILCTVLIIGNLVL